MTSGLLVEKKSKEWNDKQGNEHANYFLKFLCLGFPLEFEVDYKDWIEKYKEGDVYKLRINAKNKSIQSGEKSTYNYFEPVVTGIKEGTLKDLIKMDKQKIGVAKVESISLGKNDDGTSKGNYSKVLLEGALVGEMTGSSDLAENLKDLTEYECDMSISFKRGVFQIIPSNFKEIGTIESEF